MSAQHADRGRRTELIVREVDRLGTLSPVATRLLEAASPEEVEVAELVKLMELDPALSATILRLCRTVDRGLGDRITTVHHAVVMLGLETVRSVVLGIEVLGVLRAEGERRGPSVGGFDEEGFWKHAVATASAAELIARQMKGHGVRAGEAFLAGLLHGLGRLVLHLVLPQAYDRALLVAEQRRTVSAAAERSVIGVDHHSAGRRLAERWNLPDAVRNVIWFHGQPTEGVPESAHRELVAIVNLARALCERQHLGWSGDFAPAPALDPLARAVGLDRARVEAMMARLVEEVAERCAILGLGEQSGPEVLLGAIVRANRRLGSLYAALDRETRALRRRARVGEAIGLFHDQWHGDEPIEHTAACVVASLSHLLQPRLCAVLWWTENQGWRVSAQDADGHTVGPDRLTLDADVRRVAETLSAVRGRSIPATSAIPGIDTMIAGVPDPATLLMMPVALDPSLIVAVLHDADVRGWNEEPELAPVRAVWASAMRAAEALGRSRELEDELAESNRELAEMQAELAGRESLARLGEMTAGAAHEMNNPLAVIRGRAQLLGSNLDDSDLAPSVRALVRAADDLSGLITELNRLACADGPMLREEKISDLVDHAAARAGERLGTAPDIERPCDSGEILIATDRELLCVALSELIVNAEESGSSAKVRVEVHEAGESGRIYLRVVDRGRGMSERAMTHAFDPFFSEKPAGRQRGLGLARARRCVELLEGRVWHEPNRGGGTVAIIELQTRGSLSPAA